MATGSFQSRLCLQPEGEHAGVTLGNVEYEVSVLFTVISRTKDPWLPGQSISGIEQMTISSVDNCLL